MIFFSILLLSITQFVNSTETLNALKARAPFSNELSDRPLAGGASFFMKKEKEIWKDIMGFEGRYQISNYGKVKSLGRIYIRKNNYPLKIKERILKPRKTDWDYLSTHFYKDEIEFTFPIHRLVALHFIDNPDPEKLTDVNHKDSNKQNNYYRNLEWCSRRENASHWNKRKIRSSKYTGVSRSKYTNKWNAFVYIDNKNINLGSFESEEEASDAYKQALKEKGIKNRYA